MKKFIFTAVLLLSAVAEAKRVTFVLINRGGFVTRMSLALPGQPIFWTSDMIKIEEQARHEFEIDDSYTHVRVMSDVYMGYPCVVDAPVPMDGWTTVVVTEGTTLSNFCKVLY